MTEREWLACTDAQKMLSFLRGRASDRKLRLFACAYCRHPHLWEHWLADERSRKAVEVAERFVDGEATKRELDIARRAAWAPVRRPVVEGDRSMVFTDRGYNRTAWATARDGGRAAEAAVRVVRGERLEEFQRHTLRDIVGPLPFRPVPLNPAWLAWNNGTVPKLAQAVYDERAFDRLPILADALEEAGCANADILAHCRGPGPHVRGCWLVDLLLAKQ